jgi:lipoate-protein ligase A
VRALRLLDLTLPSPAENLALDEALLDEVDERGGDPVLRFWESERHFVVLGRSSRLEDDVHVAVCERDGVPVLRRASGGGTVLQGPGCLSYALVLPLDLHPHLASIRSTYRFILDRIAGALQRWEPAIAFRGISDLAIGDMKVSGNAQRRQRRALLFHGTVLYRMQAAVITRYLKHPARQPDYRRDRSHDLFVGVLDAKPGDIKLAMAEAWSAGSTLDTWPDIRLQDRVLEVMRRSTFSAPRS